MKILRLLVITIFIVIISHLSWSKNLRTDINSFPNWTKNIIFINVKKLQPMINKYIPNKIFSNRDYIEIKRNFGIDPIKNVTKIYIGFSEIVNNKKPKFVILIHVKFNQNKIMNFIKQEGIANLQIEKLYKHPILSSASEKNFKIALINGKYIIISSYNEMKEIISLIHGKGKSINKNKGLMRELRINKKNNLFWCRFHYNNLLKEEVNNILNRSAKHKSLIKYWITKLSDINEIISSIHKKNNQIKVTIKGVTKNRSSIKELFIMLNTIKQFVYSDVIYNKNLSEIKNLIENIKITNKRNSFNINLSFTNEDISKIINYIKQQFPVSQRKQDDEKEKYIPFLRNEYWAKGKAEYQLYNHKILWYGKIRESKDSFMLIVSEQWDNKKNVKSGVNWNAEILKFSIFDIFKTGTYPYSFKSDIYFNIKNGEIVKYTMSCQVPSGTNFFRFDKRGKRGIFTWHSFWDDHGLIVAVKQTNSYDTFFDALPVYLRFRLKEKSYKLKVVQPLIANRPLAFKNTNPSIDNQKDALRKGIPHILDVSVTNSPNHTINASNKTYKAIKTTINYENKTDTYYFNEKFPHTLIKWEGNAEKTLYFSKFFRYWILKNRGNEKDYLLKSELDVKVSDSKVDEHNPIIVPLDRKSEPKGVYEIPEFKLALDKEDDDDMTIIVQVKLGLAYSLNNQKVLEEIISKKEQIIDKIQFIIARKKYKDINRADRRNKGLKEDILTELNKIMQKGKIEDVYFDTFIISRIPD